MPDGLPVAHRPPDALTIDLARAAPDPDGIWRVALALPARASGQQAGPRRYLDRGSSRVDDDNPGGAGATVSLLRPNLQLVAGSGQGYASDELLPLLQFRDGGGAPVQAPYIAPWLRIGPALPLYARVDGLCRNLRGNYTTLANERTGDAALQARHLAVLPQLGARLLELEALYADGAAHPQQLYLQLAGLLGALTAGVPALALARLPRFDYRDMAPAFDVLFGQIEHARMRLAPDFDWCPFSARGPHDFDIDLASVGAAAPYVIALQKPLRASDADMQRWLREALVCSAGREEDLQRRRSRGIGKVTLVGEEALRIGADGTRTVFRLDVAGDAAGSFDPDAPLRILGPGGSADNYVEPLAIELLLRRRGDAGEAR
jgi:type VI secretion system protein ImpJ